ncbi:hypothetical protein D3C72_1412340 [compost metagenome]
MYGNIAIAALQRQKRFWLARQRLYLCAILFDQRLRVVGTLRNAGDLALQVRPVLDATVLAADCGAALAVIGGGHIIERFGALFGVLHVGDQNIDLALLQELHAVGRRHSLSHQLDAETGGQRLGDVDVETLLLLRLRIDKAERRAGEDDADGELAATLDPVERCIRVSGGCHRSDDDGSGDEFCGKSGERKGHGYFLLIVGGNYMRHPPRARIGIAQKIL